MATEKVLYLSQLDAHASHLHLLVAASEEFKTPIFKQATEVAGLVDDV